MSDPIHTSIPVLSTHTESKEWISNSQLTLSSSLKNFCNDAFNRYFLAGMTLGRATGILMKCESFSIFSKLFGNSLGTRTLAGGMGLAMEGAVFHIAPQVLERGEFIREGVFLGSLNSSLTILACQIAMRGAPPNRVMREVTMNASIMSMEALTQVIGISDQPIQHRSAFDWYLSTQLASFRVQMGSHFVQGGLPHISRRESRTHLSHEIDKRGVGNIGWRERAKEFFRVPTSLLPGRLAPEGPEGEFNSAIGAKEEARGFQMTRSGEGGGKKVTEATSQKENPKLVEGEVVSSTESSPFKTSLSPLYEIQPVKTSVNSPFSVYEVSFHKDSGGFPGIVQGGIVADAGIRILSIFDPANSYYAWCDVRPDRSPSDRHEFEITLRKPIVPGGRFLTLYSSEGNEASLAFYAHETGATGSVVATVTSKPLEESSPSAKEDLIHLEASGSFHCIDSCVTFGSENPVGLHLEPRYRLRESPGGGKEIDLIWVDLPMSAAETILPVIDELGWWMGAALSGKAGISTKIKLKPRSTIPNPKSQDGIRVAVSRPEKINRRLLTIPVSAINKQTGQPLVTAEVDYMPQVEVAKAGMGESRDISHLEFVLAKLRGEDPVVIRPFKPNGDPSQREQVTKIGVGKSIREEPFATVEEFENARAFLEREYLNIEKKDMQIDPPLSRYWQIDHGMEPYLTVRYKEEPPIYQDIIETYTPETINSAPILYLKAGPELTREAHRAMALALSELNYRTGTMALLDSDLGVKYIESILRGANTYRETDPIPETKKIEATDIRDNAELYFMTWAKLNERRGELNLEPILPPFDLAEILPPGVTGKYLLDFFTERLRRGRLLKTSIKKVEETPPILPTGFGWEAPLYISISDPRLPLSPHPLAILPLVIDVGPHGYYPVPDPQANFIVATKPLTRAEARERVTLPIRAERGNVLLAMKREFLEALERISNTVASSIRPSLREVGNDFYAYLPFEQVRQWSRHAADALLNHLQKSLNQFLDPDFSPSPPLNLKTLQEVLLLASHAVNIDITRGNDRYRLLGEAVTALDSGIAVEFPLATPATPSSLALLSRDCVGTLIRKVNFSTPETARIVLARRARGIGSFPGQEGRVAIQEGALLAIASQFLLGFIPRSFSLTMQFSSPCTRERELYIQPHSKFKRALSIHEVNNQLVELHPSATAAWKWEEGPCDPLSPPGEGIPRDRFILPNDLSVRFNFNELGSYGLGVVRDQGEISKLWTYINVGETVGFNLFESTLKGAVNVAQFMNLALTGELRMLESLHLQWGSSFLPNSNQPSEDQIIIFANCSDSPNRVVVDVVNQAGELYCRLTANFVKEGWVGKITDSGIKNVVRQLRGEVAVRPFKPGEVRGGKIVSIGSRIGDLPTFEWDEDCLRVSIPHPKKSPISPYTLEIESPIAQAPNGGLYEIGDPHALQAIATRLLTQTEANQRIVLNLQAERGKVLLVMGAGFFEALKRVDPSGAVALWSHSGRIDDMYYTYLPLEQVKKWSHEAADAFLNHLETKINQFLDPNDVSFPPLTLKHLEEILSLASRVVKIDPTRENDRYRILKEKVNAVHSLKPGKGDPVPTYLSWGSAALLVTPSSYLRTDRVVLMSPIVSASSGRIFKIVDLNGPVAIVEEIPEAEIGRPLTTLHDNKGPVKAEPGKIVIAVGKDFLKTLGVASKNDSIWLPWISMEGPVDYAYIPIEQYQEWSRQAFFKLIDHAEGVRLARSPKEAKKILKMAASVGDINHRRYQEVDEALRMLVLLVSAESSLPSPNYAGKVPLVVRDLENWEAFEITDSMRKILREADVDDMVFLRESFTVAPVRFERGKEFFAAGKYFLETLRLASRIHAERGEPVLLPSRISVEGVDYAYITPKEYSEWAKEAFSILLNHVDGLYRSNNFAQARLVLEMAAQVGDAKSERYRDLERLLDPEESDLWLII